MGDRFLAIAVVFGVSPLLYRALTIAQRACLRRLRWHRRYADWYAGAARGCRRIAAEDASRAERAAGARARAFYRRRSETLPREAARHEESSKAHALRARFWDFLS